MPTHIKTTALGRLISLNDRDAEEMQFFNEVFGLEAKSTGWGREGDRVLYFSNRLTEPQAQEKLDGADPPSILEVDPPPLPNGPISQPFLTMPDGLEVTWIRHPEALPPASRSHWRHHTHLFVLKNERLEFTAYTSIFAYAHLEGADSKFRIFGPGGIRWIDYPSESAAINDALDMSLAVAMKIQVVGTPCAGNKVAIYGNYDNVGPALHSLFAAYERMGLIVTSADLGLSIDQLERYALPVASTCLVPLGAYQKGIPSALITADAAFAGLEAMAECLAGSPKLGELTASLQGIGEVGSRMAGSLIDAGSKIIISEANFKTRAQFENAHRNACDSGQVCFLDDLDGIYDVSADIFVPCALRDILTAENLARLMSAGVEMIGGPANNLFPDQVTGPWQYHEAGLPVVPYEGIGAGGVTGVAYSIMTGVYGQAPFTPQQKIEMIRDYITRIMKWSREYDLPPQ
jgi:glutamate dehydrogenase/leucine dehydrogenase